MIEDTILDDKQIIELVARYYGIAIDNVTKLDRGSANIYSLNHRTYILKEFQSSYKIEDLLKEIEIINHLNRNNFLVPQYYETKEKKFFVVYKNRLIILQKFIAGETKEMHSGEYEEVIDSAMVLAKMTLELKSLNYKLPIMDYKKWINPEDLGISKAQLKSFIDNLDNKFFNIKEELSVKLTIFNKIEEKIKTLDFDNLTILNTHGDYNVLQCIYKDNKICSVLDFVTACKMPIVWEVIRSYSYIDKCAIDGEFNLNNLIDYVFEFNKIIPLTKKDLIAMPYLYLCQLLSSNFGYKQYIKDTSKIDLLKFAQFRTKLCIYLFKNMDNIIEMLLTKI